MVRIGSRAICDLEHERDDRHRAMLHRPHVQAVRQPVLRDGRQPESRVEAYVWQPAAIDGHQDTDTALEPESAIVA
jgi:hypothetical protein